MYYTILDLFTHYIVTDYIIMYFRKLYSISTYPADVFNFYYTTTNL